MSTPALRLDRTCFGERSAENDLLKRYLRVGELAQDERATEKRLRDCAPNQNRVGLASVKNGDPAALELRKGFRSAAPRDQEERVTGRSLPELTSLIYLRRWR